MQIRVPEISNIFVVWICVCAAGKEGRIQIGIRILTVPLTNGSGSGRPENMRIRFRIRTGILYIIDILCLCMRVCGSRRYLGHLCGHGH
jgi:hypothetical protein